MCPQIVERATRQIPQIDVLQVLPNVLLRGNLWRIWRKVLDDHSVDRVELTELLQLSALVDPGTVPEEEYATRDMREQVAYKLHSAISPDGVL